MPLYYFDVQDGFVLTDHDGTDLPNAVQARIEAVRFAGAYLHDRPDLVWDGHQLRVMVFDEDRELLTTVTVSASDTPSMMTRVELESKGDEPT